MDRRRTFKYGTREVAEAAKTSVVSVRRHVREGKLDMSSLWSVARYIVLRANG